MTRLVANPGGSVVVERPSLRVGAAEAAGGGRA